MKRHMDGLAFTELILRRLILNPYLKEGEPFQGLKKYQFSHGFDTGDIVIPQSSTLTYTKILEEIGCIRRTKKIKFRTGLDTITYDITTYGFIKWFSTLDIFREKGDQKKDDLHAVQIAIEKSQRLLPFLLENWVQLREIFRNERMMILILLQTSREIEVYHFRNNKFSQFSASAPINVGFFKIYVTNQLQKPLSEFRPNTWLDEVSVCLEQLFTFIYLHALLIGCAKDKNDFCESRKKLLRLLKSCPTMYHAYVQFLDQLEKDLRTSIKYVRNFKANLIKVKN